jgi:hypothetical protein
VNVYVHGRDAPYPAALAPPIEPPDDTRLLPAIAGGSGG